LRKCKDAAAIQRRPEGDIEAFKRLVYIPLPYAGLEEKLRLGKALPTILNRVGQPWKR
jgi:hypothetical protein